MPRRKQPSVPEPAAAPADHQPIRLASLPESEWAFRPGPRRELPPAEQRAVHMREAGASLVDIVRRIHCNPYRLAKVLDLDEATIQGDEFAAASALYAKIRIGVHD